jgi:hypothetical protein
LVICGLERTLREELGRWNTFHQLDLCALRANAGDDSAFAAEARTSTAMTNTVDQPNLGWYQSLPLRQFLFIRLKLKIGTVPRIAPGILVFLRWGIVRGIDAAIRCEAKLT